MFIDQGLTFPYTHSPFILVPLYTSTYHFLFLFAIHVASSLTYRHIPFVKTFVNFCLYFSSFHISFFAFSIRQLDRRIGVTSCIYTSIVTDMEAEQHNLRDNPQQGTPSRESCKPTGWTFTLSATWVRSLKRQICTILKHFV